MPQAFNINARLQLQGPFNVQPVVQSLRSQLGNLSAQITPTISPTAAQTMRSLAGDAAKLSANIADATRKINALKSTAASVAIPSNLGGGVNRVRSDVDGATRAARKLRDSIIEVKSASELAGEMFGATTRRFGTFYVVARSINAVAQQFGEAVRGALEFQHEMVKLSQIGGTTSLAIKDIGDEIGRLATTMGASSQALSQVSVTLRQAGFDAAETKTVLEALAKTTLTPTFESLKSTTEGVIAMRQQFDVTANDVAKRLGAINTVAGEFAVESEDLITAIRKSGGAFRAASGDFSTAEESFNQLLALFTSVRNTTRESADEIATGMRTIFARVQGNTVSNALKDMGINLRYTREEAQAMGKNVQGQFVGAYEAIKRLSAATRDLPSTDPRYSQIVEQLGGFRQISRVIPLLQQFETAQKAYGVAQAGSDSLTRDSLKAQDAFVVKLAKVKEEFADLLRTVANNKPLQEMASMFLAGAQGAIKLAHALEPLAPLIAIIAGVKTIKAFGTFAQGGYRAITNISGAASAIARRDRTDLSTVVRRRDGGVIPGHGVGDKVPLLAEPGEFVLNRRAARSIGYAKLAKWNAGKYKNGGAVKRLPILVEPGEYFFDRESVTRIGAGKLAQANRTGRLPVDVQMKIGGSGEPSRFQTGGRIRPEDVLAILNNRPPSQLQRTPPARALDVEKINRMRMTERGGVSLSEFRRSRDPETGKPAIGGHIDGLSRLRRRFEIDPDTGKPSARAQYYAKSRSIRFSLNKGVPVPEKVRRLIGRKVGGETPSAADLAKWFGPGGYEKFIDLYFEMLPEGKKQPAKMKAADVVQLENGRVLVPRSRGRGGDSINFWKDADQLILSTIEDQSEDNPFAKGVRELEKAGTSKELELGLKQFLGSERKGAFAPAGGARNPGQIENLSPLEHGVARAALKRLSHLRRKGLHQDLFDRIVKDKVLRQAQTELEGEMLRAPTAPGLPSPSSPSSPPSAAGSELATPGESTAAKFQKKLRDEYDKAVNVTETQKKKAVREHNKRERAGAKVRPVSLSGGTGSLEANVSGSSHVAQRSERLLSRDDVVAQLNELGGVISHRKDAERLAKELLGKGVDSDVAQDTVLDFLNRRGMGEPLSVEDAVAGYRDVEFQSLRRSAGLDSSVGDERRLANPAASAPRKAITTDVKRPTPEATAPRPPQRSAAEEAKREAELRRLMAEQLQDDAGEFQFENDPGLLTNAWGGGDEFVDPLEDADDVERRRERVKKKRRAAAKSTRRVGRTTFPAPVATPPVQAKADAPARMARTNELIRADFPRDDHPWNATPIPATPPTNAQIQAQLAATRIAQSPAVAGIPPLAQDRVDAYLRGLPTPPTTAEGPYQLADERRVGDQTFGHVVPSSLSLKARGYAMSRRRSPEVAEGMTFGGVVPPPSRGRGYAMSRNKFAKTDPTMRFGAVVPAAAGSGYEFREDVARREAAVPPVQPVIATPRLALPAPTAMAALPAPVAQVPIAPAVAKDLAEGIKRLVKGVNDNTDGLKDASGVGAGNDGGSRKPPITASGSGSPDGDDSRNPRNQAAINATTLKALPAPSPRFATTSGGVTTDRRAVESGVYALDEIPGVAPRRPIVPTTPVSDEIDRSQFYRDILAGQSPGMAALSARAASVKARRLAEQESFAAREFVGPQLPPGVAVEDGFDAVVGRYRRPGDGQDPIKVAKATATVARPQTGPTFSTLRSTPVPFSLQATPYDLAPEVADEPTPLSRPFGHADPFFQPAVKIVPPRRVDVPPSLDASGAASAYQRGNYTSRAKLIAAMAVGDRQQNQDYLKASADKIRKRVEDVYFERLRKTRIDVANPDMTTEQARQIARDKVIQREARGGIAALNDTIVNAIAHDARRQGLSGERFESKVSREYARQTSVDPKRADLERYHYAQLRQTRGHLGENRLRDAASRLADRDIRNNSAVSRVDGQISDVQYIPAQSPYAANRDRADDSRPKSIPLSEASRRKRLSSRIKAVVHYDVSRLPGDFARVWRGRSVNVPVGADIADHSNSERARERRRMSGLPEDYFDLPESMRSSPISPPPPSDGPPNAPPISPPGGPPNGPPNPPRRRSRLRRVAAGARNLLIGDPNSSREERLTRRYGNAMIGVYGAGVLSNWLDSNAGGETSVESLEANASKSKLRGAFGGAALGAQIGAIGGPPGMAVGLLAGGLLGLTSAINDTASKINEVKLGESIKRLGMAVDDAASGRLSGRVGIGAVNAGIAGARKDIVDQAVSDNSGLLSLSTYMGAGYRENAIATSIRDKEANELSQYAPQIRQAMEAAVAAIKLPDSAFDNIADDQAEKQRGVRRKALLADGGGELLSTLSQITKTPMERLIREFDVALVQANKARKSEDVNLKLANAVDINIRKFERLGSALDAAAVAVRSFGASADTIEMIAQGRSGTTAISGVADQVGMLGGVDDHAVKNTTAFMKSSLGSVGAGIVDEYAGLIEEMDDVKRTLADRLTEAAQGGKYTEDSIIGDVNKAFDGFGKSTRDRLESKLKTMDPKTVLQELSANPERLADQIASAVFDETRKIYESVVKSLEQRSQQFGSDLARHGQLAQQAQDTRSRIPGVDLDILRSRADVFRTLTGRSAELSLGDLQSPFDSNQRTLAQNVANPLDANQIAGRIRQIAGDADAQDKIARDVNRSGGDRKQAQIEFERLTRESSNLHRALANLADSSQRLSAVQEKMAEVDREYAGKLSLVERVLTGGPEEQFQFQKGVFAANVAGNQGNFAGFSGENIKLVLDTLRAFGDVKLQSGPLQGFTGNEAAERLLANTSRLAGTPEFNVGEQVRERLDLQGRRADILEDGRKAIEATANLQQDLASKFFENINRGFDLFFVNADRRLAESAVRDARGQVNAATNETGRREALANRAVEMDRMYGLGAGDNGLDRARRLAAQSSTLDQIAGDETLDANIQKAMGPRNQNGIAAGGLGEFITKSVQQNAGIFGDSAFKTDSFTSGAVGRSKYIDDTRSRLHEIKANIATQTGLDESIVEKAIADYLTNLQQSIGKLPTGGDPFNPRGGRGPESWRFSTGGEFGKALDRAANATQQETLDRLRRNRNDVATTVYNSTGGAAMIGVVNAVKNRETLPEDVKEMEGFASSDAVFKYFEEQKTAAESIKDNLTKAAAALEEVMAKGRKADPNFGKGAAGMATGGVVFRPRGTDTVPAMLTPKEFVVNARQAQANRGLLERINRGNGPVYLATGGFASSRWPVDVEFGDASTIEYREALGRFHKQTDAMRSQSRRLAAEARDRADQLREDWAARQTKTPPTPTPPAPIAPTGLATVAVSPTARPIPSGRLANGPIINLAEIRRIDAERQRRNEVARLAVMSRGRDDQQKSAKPTVNPAVHIAVPGETMRANIRKDAIRRRNLKLPFVGPPQPAKPRGVVRRASATSSLVGPPKPKGWSRRRNPVYSQGGYTPFEASLDAMLWSGGMYFAEGGMVPRGSDAVPAMLTAGEFVVDKKTTAAHLPLLQSLKPIYREKGGSVGASTATVAGQTNGTTTEVAGVRELREVLSGFGKAMEPLRDVAAAIGAFDQSQRAMGGAMDRWVAASAPLSQSLGGFADAANNLAKILPDVSIPSTISIQTQHSVEVLINGAQVLAAIKGDMAQVVTQAVLEKLDGTVKRIINEMPVR